MNRLFTFACIFSIVLLFSCGSQQKNGQGKLLSTEKMEGVLWDMLQADAFTQNFIKKDSSKNEFTENAALQGKIFELHKITREDFNTSYNYYTAHPEIMRMMLDTISARAERDRSKIMMERYGGVKTERE